MNYFQLALRNLAFHWRANAAVALGVAAATAVLTGALVVGDSVRGSLRQIVLDRLGKIDAVLATPRFFTVELANQVATAAGDAVDAVVPAIVLQGTLENPSGGHRQRAGEVAVFGVTPEFWQLGQGGPKESPNGDQIVLNQPLADELQIKPGDEVILRLAGASDVPADSPLGRKTEMVRSRRFAVSQVIPASGLGRFGLRPTQQLPLNAFAPLAALQRMVEAAGGANLILVSSKHDAAEKALADVLRPSLADYGITVKYTDRGYATITTDRMLLEPAVEDAAMRAFRDQGAQEVFTYLANYILADDGKGKIPYSTVAAIDFTRQPPLGPFVNRQGQPIGPLDEGEIVLNAWAADDLAAQGVALQPGDEIEITYFEPESSHGKTVEARHTFKLQDIVALEGAADDRDLTPEVRGVTDEESIADWDPPFPYDSSRVRSVPPNDQDDRYWRDHRATPKAFVSLEQGRKLWGSRFGQATSIRVPPAEGIDEQTIARRLEGAIDPTKLGFEWLPVKRLGLQAAAGTTPFAVLFLMFSIFIIAAAAMLILLLFRLGVAQRAAELGVELATGFRHSLVRRVLLVEGACVAAVGAAAGMGLGLGYAWLMTFGLKTWWIGAISTPFLELYVQPSSLAAGFGCGFVLSILTIVWALRELRRVSVRRLLAGQVVESRFQRSGRVWSWMATVAALMAAIALVGAATLMQGEAQTGAFMGSGALVLIGVMALIWNGLSRDTTSSIATGRAALVWLAVRNAGRFPLRSVLAIGLMAIACFLIVGLSAFRLDPPQQGPGRDSGDGGFALIAQSDQPIYKDLNSPEGRREFGVDDAPDATLYALRVNAGDDASCLNLYQPRQPRVLGVTDRFIERGGFAWAATAAQTPEEQGDPWVLLNRKRSEDREQIPVILDQNTALYSLHLTGGVGETFEFDDPRGGKITLRVVGLLKNSIFQGELLIGEHDFLRLFPDVSGYRMFLIEAPAGDADRLAQTLEAALGDYGFDTQTTSARLAAFFAVQNTYLATFQALGGVGLLLGTFGVAAVQLRNIVERRGELALLQAMGFRHSRLTSLVMLENACLLIGGLAAGVIAAMAALVPHLLVGGASLPWLGLGGTLALVLIVGATAGWVGVRAMLSAPLVPALRGE